MSGIQADSGLFSARAGNLVNTRYQIVFGPIQARAGSSTSAMADSVILPPFPYVSNSRFEPLPYPNFVAIGSSYVDIVFSDFSYSYIDSLSLSGSLSPSFVLSNTANASDKRYVYPYSAYVVGVCGDVTDILFTVSQSTSFDTSLSSVSFSNRTIVVNGLYDYIAVRCYYNCSKFVNTGFPFPFFNLSLSGFSSSAQVGESIREILLGIRDALGGSTPNYNSILAAIRGDIQAMQSAVVSGLTSVGNAVQSVKDTLTSSPQQDVAASQFQQDMQGTLDEIEEANKIIEENTNRPTAEQLRPPDISTIVDTSDPGYAAAMEGIGNFLAADFMVNILLLMCTMAFCGYVLFGKKG